MKRTHIFKTILPALLLLTAVAGGDGVWAQHPNIGSISYNSTLGAYAITNFNNLKDLSVYVNGEGTYSTGVAESVAHDCSGLTFKQTSNIDCRYINDTIRAIGAYGNSQGVSSRDLTDSWRPFRGTYDGQGHVIDALKVKGDSYFKTHTQVYFCGGFFGVVDEGTVLRNIRLVNPSVCNAISLEAVMSGRAKNGRVPVDKWYSNLNCVRYDMAGIVGVTEGGSIENCYVFNPQFRFTHADSLEFLEISTYNEGVLWMDMTAICTENNSSIITNCSEVYVVSAGMGVTFADNGVGADAGFVYSGNRFYRPWSAVGIRYSGTRAGCSLGFTDGEGNNIPFSGSSPDYTLSTIEKNSVITPTFTPITYQLTYDNIDDATFITPNPTTYNIETETFSLNRPSREGYTFLGWVGTDLPRVTKEVTINRGSMGDRHYTAQWVEGVEPIFDVTNQGNRFTIKRDVTTTEQTVYYRTVALTAFAGQHFNQTSGTVTFAVGDSVKTITVTERTPSGDAYKYQTSTSRTYRFEVLDEGGFELAHRDRTITNGLTQYSATKVSKSVTNLVTISNGSISSGMSSSKYLDVSYTPPSGQVETSGTLNGYVLIDDSYDYAQKPATVSTSTLINSTGATASYLNTLGYKIYATVYFTEKERDDGYQYIQIIAGNSNASYDTGYDPDGSVNDPSNSIYKVCFELSNNSNAEGKVYFPHRSTGTDEFSHSTGKLWQQKFKSGYSASGSVLLSPTVDYITTRFDAGGNNDDTWGYKNLFVRMALCDAVAPTRLDNPVVNSGPHAKGNIAYVSVPFKEIVTVVGTPTLNTSWGTLKYIEGSGTNVLTFADTITAEVGTRLQITSCTNYSNIKDLAGNPLSSTISYYGFTEVVTASHNYTITYTLHGGTATPANPDTYNYSTASFTLTNPTRTGYTFNGWTGSDLTEASMSVTVATHSHGDKRFIANWTPITFVVVFDKNGNGATGSMDTMHFTYDEAQPLLDNGFSRTGYNYVGWSATPDGDVVYTDGESVSNLTSVDGDTVVLYAHWDIITYTISYDLSGGSVATPNATSYTVESADITLTNPTRDGYTFAGWTGTGLDAATLSVTIEHGSTGNRTYTATWTINVYTISYDLAGGSVATPNPTSYTVESTDITLVNPTRTGYTFAGWTGTDLAEPTTTVTISQGSTGDRAYTAIWTINIYTISYDLAGGSVVTPNPTSYTVESTDITLTNPTRDGYTFAGWTGTDLDEPTLNVTIEQGSTGDRTYTATWTINIYTISYDLAGGSVATPNPTSYTVESNITLVNPTRNGYDFTGWTGTGLAEPTMSVTIEDSTGDRSYTATWTPHIYAINYNLNGGSADNPTSYTIETATFTLVNPTCDGCTFAGWTGTDLSEPTTTVTIAHGSTGDLSYTATWLLTLPYSYGFEEEDGWANWSSLTGNNERIRGGIRHSGSYCLRFRGSTSNVVVLPPFNAATSSLQLSFWSTPEIINPRCGTFSVGYLTDPADAATFVAVRTYSYSDWTSNDYRRKVVNFEGVLPDNARLAFRHNPTASNYYWFVDDVVVTAPGCFAPEELEVSNISAGAATFSWLATAGTQWEYAIVANAADDYSPTDGEFTPAQAITQSSNQAITISTLSQLTDYAFFLRRACSEESKSEAVSVRFRTRMTPTALPYANDFESSNGWILENGSLTNQWVWGTAAHDDGTKSLYISNDGGATNSYSTADATVYAWKTFSFEDGYYSFSYDWRAYGEEDWDYLRVALVPDETELTADISVPDGFDHDELPDGWIALDGGSQLNDTYEWHRFTAPITVAAGSYKVVFVWRNSYYESHLPAAVDNVRIMKCKHFVAAGNWNDAAKWSPAGVPAAGESVFIEAAAVIPTGCVAVCDKAVINGGSVTIADGGQLLCNSDIPVTVQKNVAAGQWNGISGLNYVYDLTPLTNVDYDLFRYDEENAQWLNQKAGNGAAGFNKLTRFYGYIYRRAASATVDLATYNYNEFGGCYYYARCSDDALRGFNLAGNPCTHDIYFGTGIEVRNGSIAPGFYTLNPDGTWRAHTAADPIHTAEAFLIQVTTDNTALAFYNTNAAPAQSKAAPAATLAFSVKGNGHEDVAYAMMGDMGLMGSMGLRKMPHLNVEAPSLSIDGYAIATLSDSCKAFPLTLKAQPGEYTLTTQAIKQSSNQTITYCHLIDRVAGKDIDLLRDSTYTFTQSSNQAISDRFLVKLSPNAPTSQQPNASFARIVGDRIVVTGEGALEAYDVMGRKLFSTEINSQFSILNSQFPGTGVYLLRLGEKSQKIVIR